MKGGEMEYSCLLSAFYEPGSVWGILCAFDHEVFTLFLKVYMMRELTLREVMELIWDARASEELAKTWDLNFHHFTRTLLW